MNSAVSSRNFSITSYTVAASALAALFSGTDANADVITYDNGGAGWTAASSSGTIISLNLDGDVRVDGTTPENHQFSFDHVVTEPSETSPGTDKLKVTAGPGVGTSASLTPLANPTPLVGGATIGSTMNTPASANGVMAGKPQGTWSSGQRAFLGLAFENNGALHFGWADVTMHNLGSVTLHGYAYESVAGMDIITPVPEPAVSTLLMAAGAGGVIALRQRRKASKAAATA